MADIKAYKARSPEEREIVIFKRGGTLYVKRVIGVPGSTLEGRNGEVRLNGIPLQEPYIMHTMPHMMNQLANFGPVQIPAGKLFLMGDNRDVSRDSRSADFGLVDVTELVGKPLYVYYGQLGRIGKNIE